MTGILEAQQSGTHTHNNGENKGRILPSTSQGENPPPKKKDHDN